MPAAKPIRRVRRTQEERSTATRALVLDATIDSLIELGYAATTTTVIADRAGVSRGAQLHHYPTKAELVAAALEHLAGKISAELTADIAATGELPDGDARALASIDALGRRDSSPLFHAWLELWVAARTDDDLRRLLAPTEERIRNGFRKALGELFGPSAASEAMAELWSLTFYLLQGMAFERALGMESRRARERREARALEAWKGVLTERLGQAVTA